MIRFMKLTTVTALLLSLGVLYMGILLFSDREMLKARILRLEQGIVEMGTTIESDAPEQGAHPLEEQGSPTVSVDVDALKSYVVMDPTTGKPMKDLNGELVTTGPGTTDAVMSDLYTQARTQYARLNDTRSSLTDTRVALEDTTDTLNETLATLSTTEADLLAARQDNERLHGIIAEKNDEIRTRDGVIADRESEINDLSTEIYQLADERAGLKDHIDHYRAYIVKLGGDPDRATEIVAMMDGKKGVIKRVDNNLRFVIFRYDGADREVQPKAELLVKRGGDAIGKVVVERMLEGRPYAIASITAEWRDQKIQSGDELIF